MAAERGGVGRGTLFVEPDVEAFRRWLRERKPLDPVDKRVSEQEAVRRLVKKGDYVATDMYGMVRAPMSIVREIIRQGPAELSVAGQGGMDIDLLVASGLVKRIDGVYIGHEVFGISAAYGRAVSSGRVDVTEWSNAALAWRLRVPRWASPTCPQGRCSARTLSERARRAEPAARSPEWISASFQR